MPGNPDAPPVPRPRSLSDLHPDYQYVDWGWLSVDTSDPGFNPAAFVELHPPEDIENLVKYTWNVSTDHQRMWLYEHFPDIIGDHILTTDFTGVTKPIGAP